MQCQIDTVPGLNSGVAGDLGGLDVVLPTGEPGDN